MLSTVCCVSFCFVLFRGLLRFERTRNNLLSVCETGRLRSHIERAWEVRTLEVLYGTVWCGGVDEASLPAFGGLLDVL